MFAENTDHLEQRNVFIYDAKLRKVAPTKLANFDCLDTDTKFLVVNLLERSPTTLSIVLPSGLVGSIIQRNRNHSILGRGENKLLT